MTTPLPISSSFLIIVFFTLSLFSTLAAPPRTPQTQTSAPQAQTSGLQTQAFDPQTQVSGPQAQTSGPQTLGPQTQVSGPPAQASGSQAQASGSQAQASGPQTRRSSGPGPAVAERMRLFKTEVIKERILSEVNLKEPPLISAPLSIPDNVIQLLESKEVEEAILAEGENLIAYPLNESTSCENIAYCSRYEFELPSDNKPVSSMHIWIRRTAPGDQPMDMTVCIATSNDDEEEERRCEHLKNITEVKSEKGWGIYELPRRLVLESDGNQLLCTVDIIGPATRDDKGDPVDDHKPFIVASMSSSESAERKRRSISSTSGASKNCTCCLVDFYVSFKEIGWHWVVAPLGFNANMCFGRCSNQINSYPTHYHQMLSTILNNKTSEKKEDMWTPCCSSTKLSPLNMIYVAGNNTNTNSTNSFIYHKIPNMITDSCGCW